MEWVVPAVVLFCVFLAAASFILACYAAHLAIKTQIDMKGLQNSTHNIQFVEAKPPMSDDDDLNRAMAMAEEEDMRRAGDIHYASEPLM